jgi:hypothetical protein
MKPNLGEEVKALQTIIPVMSCDEAILYLAQVHEATRTGNDEVSELSMGFGQGLSKRVRASNSVEQKLTEARETLQKATMENKEAAAQRAKALWHLALEMVTMGELPNRFVGRVNSKFRTLWRWRSLVSAHSKVDQAQTQLPVLLRRGWRPSTSLTENWHRIRPEFFWSHPNTFLFESIPSEVEVKEVAIAVVDAMVECGVCESPEAAQQRFQLIEMERSSSAWKAGFKFDLREDAAAVLQRAATMHGIRLASSSTIPHVEDHIAATKAAYDEANAAYLVRSQRLRSRSRSVSPGADLTL